MRYAYAKPVPALRAARPTLLYRMRYVCNFCDICEVLLESKKEQKRFAFLPSAFLFGEYWFV